MWKYYALLSALFAAFTAIFAKIGMKNIDSNLATAIRTSIVLFFCWGVVLFSNSFSAIKSLNKTHWTFLMLSGTATAISWLFYFKALQIGEASKVAPIDKLSVAFTILLSFLILKEDIGYRTIVGGLLIVAGSLVILTDK